MQSYKHLRSIPDSEYLIGKVSPIKYKELVDRETCMPDLRSRSWFLSSLGAIVSP